MAVDIAAKPSHAGDPIGKIKPIIHRPVEVFRRHPMLDREDELAQCRPGHRRCVHGPDLPIDSQKRGGTGLKMNVRRPLFDTEPNQLVEIHETPRSP